jgi:hypothetical protein
MHVDAPGALSILVQGPLHAAEAKQLAHRCEHWRALFPAAELIFAISSSDCLLLPPGWSGVLDRISLAPDVYDESLTAAIHAIAAACNTLVVASEALPLPPMKSDSTGPNHVNLMIAAAQTGLALASGRYVLRIRSDLILRTRGFLATYQSELSFPRGQWSLFEQRVMIPEVFTLNPVTLSRMPFHFSDWFHFGLLSDVRLLWNRVKPMSVEDATYYVGRAHSSGSNLVERRFRSRFAPEQVVSFPALHRAFPTLKLDHHNDLTSLNESLLVLADNFILADLTACDAQIAKYQHVVDAMSPYTRLECLSQDLIRLRASRRDLPTLTVFAALSRKAAAYDSASARARRKTRSLWIQYMGQKRWALRLNQIRGTLSRISQIVRRGSPR